MSLRFFADHCVPHSMIQALRDAGYEVLRLRDFMPTESSDPIVISKAQEFDAILISLNGDLADQSTPSDAPDAASLNIVVRR